MLVTCDRVGRWVDALGDDEIGGLRRIFLRRHLDTCPGCRARLDEAVGLRRRIREEVPRFAAPASLRERLTLLARDGAAAAAIPRSHWRWALGGAAAGIAVTIVAVIAFGAIHPLREHGDGAVAMVDEHARATLEGRSVVMASSDRHTVRPWLSSHLDYSPPVHDFADDGFALAGARIVRLSGQPTAVLAYRYRLHAIDVYVQPAAEAGAMSAATTVRGFNVLPLTAHGMQWTIVSDASPETLDRLAGDLRDAGP